MSSFATWRLIRGHRIAGHFRSIRSERSLAANQGNGPVSHESAGDRTVPHADILTPDASRLSPACARSLPRWASGIRGPVLAVFTRQLATLVEAGLPLLPRLEDTSGASGEVGRCGGSPGTGAVIENGGCRLPKRWLCTPGAFNGLYVNMVEAGELGGALDVTLRRLAEFMEKAQKIKGKVNAAMYYPCAVLTVAMVILSVLMTYVVPRVQGRVRRMW